MAAIVVTGTVPCMGCSPVADDAPIRPSLAANFSVRLAGSVVGGSVWDDGAVLIFHEQKLRES